MDVSEAIGRKQVIRSAGRSRVRVPSSVLSRIPRGEVLSGLDQILALADGDTDGIGRCRGLGPLQNGSQVSRRNLMKPEGLEATTPPGLSVFVVSFLKRREWCVFIFHLHMAAQKRYNWCALFECFMRAPYS